MLKSKLVYSSLLWGKNESFMRIKKISAQSNGFEAPTKFPAKRDSLIFTLAKKDLFAIINYGFNSYQDSYNFLANSLYIYDVLTCSSSKTDYYP